MPAKRIESAGTKYGRYTLMHEVEKLKGNTYWMCKCECGTEKITKLSSLVIGVTVSCGCYHREVKRSHGMWNTATYKIWQNIIQRCRNPKNSNYPRYGGKGIAVCNEWLDFNAFLSDMGVRPKGLSIERKNNNGNYEPSNCIWATVKEQQNNRNTNVLLTHCNQTLTQAQWAERLGISQDTIRRRRKRGWSISRIIQTETPDRFLADPSAPEFN